MNAYTKLQEYEDSRKIVEYSSTFNTESKLEFNILPDKRFLSLRDTLLKFSIEIPEELVPDNFLASTLFENLGFQIFFSKFFLIIHNILFRYLH